MRVFKWNGGRYTLMKILRKFFCLMGYHSFHWTPRGILGILRYACRHCDHFEDSVSLSPDSE